MKNLILVSLLAITMFSCSKSDFENGTVIFSDPALDGIGWAIQIGDISYLPTNLKPQYKQDRLSIELKYDVLSDRIPCGDGFSCEQIEILEIK